MFAFIARSWPLSYDRKRNQLEQRVRECVANFALHRIAARLRIGMKPKGHGWAARGELLR